jgi:hypothetical protein
MSQIVINYSGQLVTVVCWCGVRHAVPAELREHQRRQRADGKQQHEVYCPLGHAYIIAGEGESEGLKRRLEAERSEAARLKRRLEVERSHAARLAAERDQAEASARAYKGVATKARERAAAAVCPCCNRSFVQLRRHLATKHPDYTGELA